MPLPLDAVRQQLSHIILGKTQAIKLALSCLLAGGHLLIEDIPGVGKTTLAQALAHTLGLSFQRIQFTSDLLPSDLTGANVFDRASGNFVFHPGPVFTEVLLGDEINRGSPKTQGALLEAMEERQVTVDGVTRALPSPFFVIATQNPLHQIGTFPLPESQLDRFLMCISLGYPDPRAERALLAGGSRRLMLAQAPAQLDRDGLAQAQAHAAQVHASEALLDYVLALLARSRLGGEFTEGLSPRAGLALMGAARAWAYLEGRDYLLPEDIQAVLPSTVGHRLRSGAGPGAPTASGTELAQALLRGVAIPA